MSDPFRLGGREWRSRLLLGTGGFRSHDVFAEAAQASGAEIATVAPRCRSSRATAAPIPLDPPMTQATLPLSFMPASW